MHQPYQAPTGIRSSWEHTTATLGTGSFESAPHDLNHAALGVHHPSLPPELPSTIQPVFIPSVSSSTTATPFSAQPSFLDGSATLPEIPPAVRQGFGCPRACVVDGLLVDEEDLRNQDTDNGCISVHVCNREDSPCGLWVKADRRSIIVHGQRWHGDARGGGDRKITCPWSGCDSQMLASAIPRHTLSAHFGAVWICRGAGCSKVFTRYYSFKAHSRKFGCLEASVRYDTSTRVINTTSL
jgi:hypothetical protein